VSASSAKSLRRDLRRAMGNTAVNAVAEMQQNIATMANSLQNAHKRIDELQEQVKAIDWRGDQA